MQSITSKISVTKKPPVPEDGVKLSVYGIDEPGMYLSHIFVFPPFVCDGRNDYSL